MTARLFQAARTAMQQGKGKTKAWTLEFMPTKPREIEPLMGWTASNETLTQIRLHFESKEEGLAYAQQQGLMVMVDETPAKAQKIKPKAYADNFAADRLLRWTH